MTAFSFKSFLQPSPNYHLVSRPQILRNWFYPLSFISCWITCLSTDRKISDFSITFVTYILKFDLHLFEIHLATPLFSHDKNAIWKWVIWGWSFSLLTVIKLTYLNFRDLNQESMDNRFRTGSKKTSLKHSNNIKNASCRQFRRIPDQNGLKSFSGEAFVKIDPKTNFSFLVY